MIAEMNTIKKVGCLEKSSIYKNDNIPEIYFYEEFTGDIPAALKLISNDLKKNTIHVNYSTGMAEEINIYANNETINKVIENTKKLYLIEVVEEDGYKKVLIHDDKVYINNNIGISYNALDDTISGDFNNKCKRYYEDTQYGQKMTIDCINEITEE